MTDEPVRLASANGQQLRARAPGASPSTDRFPQPGDDVPGAPPPLEGTVTESPSVNADAATVPLLSAGTRRQSVTDRRAMALVLALLVAGFAAIQLFRRRGGRPELAGSRMPVLVRTPARGTR